VDYYISRETTILLLTVDYFIMATEMELRKQWFDALSRYELDASVYSTCLSNAKLKSMKIQLVQLRQNALLHLAASNGRSDLMQIVLDNGGYSTIEGDIMMKCLRSNPSMFGMLNTYGCKYYQEDSAPLSLAIELGNMSLFMELLQHGAAVDRQCYYEFKSSDYAFSRNLIKQAVKCKQEDMALYLLTNHSGWRVYSREDYGKVQFGMRLNSLRVDELFMPSLWLHAIKHNALSVMSYLLIKHEELIRKAKYRYCDAFNAVTSTTVDFLMGIPWRDDYSEEMMRGFPEGNNMYGVQALLKNGYDKDIMLDKAVDGSFRIVKHLVSQGADVKRTEVSGWLNHKARYHGNEYCKRMKFLLAAGATLTISAEDLLKHSYGWKILPKRCLTCCAQIIRSGYLHPLFLASAFEHAAASGYMGVFQAAIDTNVDLNAVDCNIVHVACAGGHMSLAKFLLDNNCAIYQYKDSSLQLCLARGSVDIVMR
jgi:hypothetical protein